MKEVYVKYLIGLIGMITHVVLFIIEGNYTDTVFNVSMLALVFVLFIWNTIDMKLISSVQSLIVLAMILVAVLMGVELVLFDNILDDAFYLLSGLLFIGAQMLEAFFIDNEKN